MEFGARSSQLSLELLAVVKGYLADAVSVSVNGQLTNFQVLVNSGALVAYSNEHAIQAINGAQKK
jgi:hypothetical protein